MAARTFSGAPLFRLLFALLGGIFLGRKLCGPQWPEWILPVLSGGLLLASLAFRQRSVYAFHPAALLLGAFLFMGMDLGRDRRVPLIPPCFITARICGECLPSGKGYRVTVDRIRRFGGDRWLRVRGKASLYLARGKSEGGSRDGGLLPGCRIYAYGSLAPYPSPLNPDQFDYGAFQRGRGVLYRAFLDPSCWRVAGSPVGNGNGPGSGMPGNARNAWRTLRGTGRGPLIPALLFRRKLMEKLERRISGEAERDILNALLLGYRDAMDPLTEQNFARSGTLHVLAVSGLHVGILYMLPALLLKRLRRFPAVRMGCSILVLGGLWGYAFVTGLSPSVVRAVSMCSIHAAIPPGSRKAGPLQAVIITAFFMILARPAAVFEAGFQLSFAAATGILLMYRRFLFLFPFPGLAGRWLSRLLAVSLAAQLSTLPLLIFHFHQAAPVSVLSNLAVIPLATLILYTGTLYFLVAGSAFAGGILGTLLGRLSGLMDGFTRTVAGLPGTWAGGLSLGPGQVILLYLTGILLLLFLERRSAGNLLLVLSVLVMLLTLTVVRGVRQQTRHGTYVFALEGKTAILFIEGRQAALFRGFDPDSGPGPDPALPYGTEGVVHRYRLHPPVQFCAEDTLAMGTGPPGLFWQPVRFPGMEAVYIVFREQRMLVLRSFDEHRCRDLPFPGAEVLVLCGNPAVNPSRLRALFGISRIVADGSNLPAYAAAMGTACREAGIAFHDAGTSGCFRH